MPDPRQLPHLLELLDDENENIRKEIFRQLLSFGPRLKEELLKLPPPLLASRTHILEDIFANYQREHLKERWADWFGVPGEYAQLETALLLLSEFQGGLNHRYNFDLKDLLNSLAAEYRQSYQESDPLLLAKFLFKDKEIQGAKDDYYNPQNSNCVYSIVERRGLPITLTCIYMLVGWRLNLRIQGYNFPGHFMAKISCNGEEKLVDAFNNGQILEENKLVHLDQNIPAESPATRAPATTKDIIRRVLTNLIYAYQLSGEASNRQLMLELFAMLPMTEKDSAAFSSLIQSTSGKRRGPLFKAGQIVLHKKSNYRGILVDVDPEYVMDDESVGEITETERRQPWYHILVDGTERISYVMQADLVPDESDMAVQHPLVGYFFTRTADGKYKRNINPWPK